MNAIALLYNEQNFQGVSNIVILAGKLKIEDCFIQCKWDSRST